MKAVLSTNASSPMHSSSMRDASERTSDQRSLGRDFAPIFHTRNASDSPSFVAKNLYQTPGYSEIYGNCRIAVFA
jgi:hypothetical protein